jgi:hypothetical protein
MGQQIFWAPNKADAIQMWSNKYFATRDLISIEEATDDD